MPDFTRYIHTTRWITLAAAVIGVAAGCRVDQQKEVARYRQEIDFPQATTRPAENARQTLNLAQALMLANQQNEKLAGQGENYLQAIINRKRSVALFLPTADLSGTYALGEAVGTNSGYRANTTDIAAIGQINLFNGFRDIAKLKVADLTIAQQKWVLLDVQESLLADVVRTYYTVLQNEQQVVVLENTLRLQEERVSDIEQRQKAGIARPLDVAQTQAQASTTRVTLINARNAVNTSRAALAFLINAPLENVTLAEVDPLAPVHHPLEELRKNALAARKDLQGAIQARDAARQNVEVAVGQYYPSASLSLKGFLYRESAPTDRDWESLLQVNLPLFRAGLIEADVRQAWSQFRQAALFEALLRRQIRQDVDVASENLASSDKRLAELQVQLAAAQQAVQQAEGSYNVGLATNIERLTAQDQLLNARLQLASETYQRRVYYADLLRASGGLRDYAIQAVAATTRPAPTTLPATVAQMR